MFFQLKKIWHPEIFQGRKRKSRYFEGWYFKCVDASCEHVIAVIPGIAVDEASSDSHAFIQVFDSLTGSAQYHRYSLSDFSAAVDRFQIQIAGSTFSGDGISLNIDSSEGKIHGNLSLHGRKPWPVGLFHPGFMGWYAFVPYMECYHGVLSFDHALEGKITLENRVMDFSGGRGYLEKDWGISFPRAWVWMQSNHFTETEISFMCSVATVPWRGNYFTGFGAGFFYKGKLYAFTKWNGARIEDLHIKENQTSFIISRARHRIEVTAEGEDAGELRSPVLGQMAGKVLESLKGRIHLRFFEMKYGKWTILFEGSGTNSGLEIMGDPQELLNGMS